MRRPLLRDREGNIIKTSAHDVPNPNGRDAHGRPPGDQHWGMTDDELQSRYRLPGVMYWRT